MNILLEKLETILGTEIDLHSAIIDSSKEINSALKYGDLENITTHKNKQDALICKVERLEEERMNCCRSIAESLGITNESLRLGELLNHLPLMWRSRINKIRQALKIQLDDITTINGANRILLEEGLHMIENTFSIFKSAAAQPYSGYGSHGHVTGSSAPLSIINRIV